MYTDFKDATLNPTVDDYLSPNGERFAGDSASGKFFNAMLELGRGQIDFPALMHMLAAAQVSRLDQSRPRHDSSLDRRELAGVDGLHHAQTRPDLSIGYRRALALPCVTGAPMAWKPPSTWRISPVTPRP